MIGKASYDKGHWLEATDHIEKALVLYKEALGDCYLLCEDGIHVNLTQPDMNPQKAALYEEYSLYAETMEYYELLVAIVKKVHVCVQFKLWLIWLVICTGVVVSYQLP